MSERTPLDVFSVFVQWTGAETGAELRLMLTEGDFVADEDAELWARLFDTVAPHWKCTASTLRLLRRHREDFKTAISRLDAKLL